MTAEQKKFYLQHRCNKCPYCESDNIQGTADGWESDDDWASNGVECLDCERTWTDIYIFQDVTD